MTTFISGTYGYSFDSTFKMPALFDVYNTPPPPEDGYSYSWGKGTTIRSPEHMNSTQDSSILNPRQPIYRHFETDVTGSGLSLTGTALTGGTVDSIYFNKSGHGYRDYDFQISNIGISVNDLNAACAISPSNAWALLTRGDDVFYAVTVAIPAEETRSWAQLIDAGAGNDYIVSSRYADYLIGGSGSNTVYAGGGNDYVFAGSNAYSALENAWSAAYGEADNDFLWAGWGSNAFLDGGSGNDVLTDGYGTDVLTGGTGSDFLQAGTGTNYLVINAADVQIYEMDTIDYFTAANNYLQLPAAWVGAVGTWYDGSSTYLVLPTGTSNFYVQVLHTTPADVWSHVYFA